MSQQRIDKLKQQIAKLVLELKQLESQQKPRVTAGKVTFTKPTLTTGG